MDNVVIDERSVDMMTLSVDEKGNKVAVTYSAGKVSDIDIHGLLSMNKVKQALYHINKVYSREIMKEAEV